MSGTDKKSPNPVWIFVQVVVGYYALAFFGGVILRFAGVIDAGEQQNVLHLVVIAYVLLAFALIRNNENGIVRAIAGLIAGLLPANGWVTFGYIGWAGEHDYGPYVSGIVICGLVSCAVAVAFVDPEYARQRKRRAAS